MGMRPRSRAIGPTTSGCVYQCRKSRASASLPARWVAMGMARGLPHGKALFPPAGSPTAYLDEAAVTGGKGMICTWLLRAFSKTALFQVPSYHMATLPLTKGRKSACVSVPGYHVGIH